MIVWVFGGTAVGKKRFIDRAVETPARFGLPIGIRGVWLADGESETGQLLQQAAHGPILVRWQWGRESRLTEIAECGKVEQQIYLVKTDLYLQAGRVIAREGELKWPELTLMREAEDVDRAVQALSMKHGIAVRFVDGNE